MKRAVAVFAGVLLGASAAFAYQVTGPVLEVDDKSIVVEKGKEKWRIKRDKDTKVTGGELKKGSRVTVEYEMTASSIEVKDAGKGKDKAKDAKKDDAKKEKDKK